MKKYFIILIFIIVFICAINKKTEAEIRVRIIASSDEISDQLEKLLVRDALVLILEEEGIDTDDEITQNLTLIKEKLKEKINEQLYNRLDISYTFETFPAKAIAGKLCPAGTYKTLLIKIGNAGGKNWWSVLYPEFFGYEYDENNEIEYRSYFYDLVKNRQK